ncbi:MAG: hypothetical protein FWC85_05015, partial [Elusimicrobia bacterium]|nr:hypothetical protein [Elusimicrobiota bacterium]
MNLAVRKLFITVFTVLFFAGAAYAVDVYLSLSMASQRSDIALEIFTTTPRSAENVRFTSQVRGIIENNLILSRYFNLVDATVGAAADMSEEERWQDLSNLAAVATVRAHVTFEGDYAVVLCRIFDVDSRQLIWEQTFREERINQRLLAHRISNEIIRRLTGEQGIATSRIAFINDNTGFRELYVIDYDGH